MSFSKNVQSFTDQYRKRLRFIARTATQDTINEAQVLTTKGGRMPLDTGFLRSSLTASTDGPPQGPTEGDGPIEGQPFAAALIRWIPEREVFWAGWTAHYARLMEIKYGYRDGAVERWREFVDKATALAKRKKL